MLSTLKNVASALNPFSDKFLNFNQAPPLPLMERAQNRQYVDINEFVRENLEEIKRNSPYWALLSDKVPWRQIQTTVSGAALLSSLISPGGWYMGLANLSPEVLKHLFDAPETAKRDKYDSQANNLEELVQEFFKEVLPKSNVYFKSVKSSALDEINKFLSSRQQRFQKWGKDDIVRILNSNLVVVRTQWHADNVPARTQHLPTQNKISLELLYGIMLSHYGEELLAFCPQLGILAVTVPFVNATRQPLNAELTSLPPLERKLKNLLEKSKTTSWSTFLGPVDPDAMTMDAYKQKLQQAIDEKQVGMKRKKKIKRLLSRLNKQWVVKDDKFHVRYGIKTLHLQYNIDYRTTYENTHVMFFKALQQCLNRFKSDIQVYNNQTLRNPRRHVLFPFLAHKHAQLRDFGALDVDTMMNELDGVANFIRRSKNVGYWTSDWQNNLARSWNSLAVTLSNWHAHVNAEQRALAAIKSPPPPVQYDLALDLNPQANAFSFTYGRAQGFGLKDGYSDSVQWFISYANNREKAYFRALLAAAPQQLGYLNAVPRSTAMAYVQDGAQAAKFIEKLDAYMLANPDSPPACASKRYIDKKFAALPSWLSKKATDHGVLYYSTVALFFAAFDDYGPEEVYLSRFPLQWPPQEAVAADRSDEEQQSINAFPQGYGGETQNKFVLYWGPNQYGGRIN